MTEITRGSSFYTQISAPDPVLIWRLWINLQSGSNPNQQNSS